PRGSHQRKHSGGEVAGRMRTNTDLPLDGFDEHGRGVSVAGCVDALSVAGGDVDGTGRCGGEGFTVGRLRRPCERAHAPAGAGSARAPPSPWTGSMSTAAGFSLMDAPRA